MYVQKFGKKNCSDNVYVEAANVKIFTLFLKKKTEKNEVFRQRELLNITENQRQGKLTLIHPPAVTMNTAT